MEKTRTKALRAIAEIKADLEAVNSKIVALRLNGDGIEAFDKQLAHPLDYAHLAVEGTISYMKIAGERAGKYLTDENEQA